MTSTSIVLIALAVAVILLLVVGFFRWRAFSADYDLELARFETRREIGNIERQTMQQMADAVAGAPSAPAAGSDIIEGTATEVDRR